MTDMHDWIVTRATITGCHFQFARMNTLTLGVPTGEKFRITFEYYVDGACYTDEFQSPVAVPQGQSMEIAYNPADPKQNTHSRAGTPNTVRNPLITLAISGSLFLSLIWLAMLRGCR